MKIKSDIPEELLSGYLDGELTPSEVASLEESLAADPELGNALRELKAISNDVSSHIRKSLSAEPLNLWSGIEKQLTPRAPASVKRKEFGRTFANFFSHSYGYAVAGVFGLMMFYFGTLSSRIADSELELSARKDEILLPLDTRQLNGNQISGDVRFVASGGTVRKNYSPRFVSPYTLRADHPARGAGYRTEPVEIEWMKCPKSVRLLRPESGDRGEAPVLWIGEDVGSSNLN